MESGIRRGRNKSASWQWRKEGTYNILVGNVARKAFRSDGMQPRKYLVVRSEVTIRLFREPDGRICRAI